ncbi:piggyBac transposable element-derived protein 4-like [Leptopilina heterotoma]|uniref:piggyBac transposable element-derived protein 4-like n=1 Tax=Leptopilina heterotoma TaxID=63436 RepID=UPI001CA8ADEC|nr:piggyBac transposable element-derived protein 4-like [Leptopilina heterotoma]
MIKFKGRLSLKQYMPMKPIKRGFKVWCLPDSQTSYILNFEIYTGKSSDSQKSEETLGERVVTNLTKELHNSRSLVAFDNFFTSLNLMTRLLEKKIFSVGTVRVNRKGLPDIMKNKSKLQRGESEIRYMGCVQAIKWMDAKIVTLLSTAHNSETSSVKRTLKNGSRIDVQCPGAIETYNRIMGGVDRFDQKKQVYSISRRSSKWWHRIFYFCIDLAIVNSLTLYQLHYKRVEDQLTFRLNLANQLIAKFSATKGQASTTQVTKKRKILEETSEDIGNHMPDVQANLTRLYRNLSGGVESRASNNSNLKFYPYSTTSKTFVFNPTF